jgi:streptogramin lyase
MIMRDRVHVTLCRGLISAAVVAALSMTGRQAQADDPNSAPNPYHAVDHWAKLPEGRAWGQAIGVDIDRDGTSLWVFDRCGGKTCTGSSLAPIQKFDASGRLVTSFGAGLINWPHGLCAAPDGGVWVTDGQPAMGKARWS